LAKLVYLEVLGPDDPTLDHDERRVVEDLATPALGGHADLMNETGEVSKPSVATTGSVPHPAENSHQQPPMCAIYAIYKESIYL